MFNSKFKRNLLLAACFSPVIIILPRLFICSWNDSLILGATILGALGTVAAVIFVVLFYQDFAANKILDKKIDVICNFLEQIKSIRIDFEYIDKSISVDKNLAFFARVSLENSGIFENLEPVKIDTNITPILFDIGNYYDEMDSLVKLSNSVFMPLELQSSFQAIRIPFFTIDKDKVNINSLVKIIFNKKTNKEYQVDGKIDAFTTVKAYFDSIQKLITDLENWIQQKSNSTVKLNLEHNKKAQPIPNK